MKLNILSVPFAGKIKDGETVKIECVDWYVHYPPGGIYTTCLMHRCCEGPAGRSRTMILQTT